MTMWFFVILTIVALFELAASGAPPVLSPAEDCKKAGIFTTDNIRDDEHGRYLMGTVRTLIADGCEHVDIILLASNTCKSISCLDTIYSGPKMNMATVEVRFVELLVEEMKLRDPRVAKPDEPAGGAEGAAASESSSGAGAFTKGEYDYFVTFGNEKIPAVSGIGSVQNTFVLPLFPFDMDRLEKDTSVSVLGSYDSIVVSSRYSYRWYAKFIEPYLLRLRSLGSMAPTIRTVIPPIPLLARPKDSPHFSAHNNTVHIVFFGDFYRRSVAVDSPMYHISGTEGHMEALQQLARLAADFPTIHIHMTMLGWRDGPDPATEPSTAATDSYITELQQFATKRKLSVKFVFEPTFAQLTEAVTPALAFWHMGASGGAGAGAAGMVGMGHGTEHHAKEGPADVGTGGSSTAAVVLGAVLVAPVVQAMSTASCIPIVARRGVGSEIVHNGKQGFLASVPEDYYAHTVDIMHASHSELDSIRWAAYARAMHFHPDKFTVHLSGVLKEAVHTAVLRKFVGQSLVKLRERHFVAAPADASERLVVVIAVDFSPTLEYVVRNALLHLNVNAAAGAGNTPAAAEKLWQVRLWLTSENMPYYRRALEDVDNIQLSLIPLHIEDEDLAANVLLKMSSFWVGISSKVKKVLLLGHDSIITHHVVEPFMQYDFIGAPFLVHVKNKAPKLYYEGSFSLRSVDVMKNMHEHSSAKVKDWLVKSIKDPAVTENVLTLEVLRYLEWEQKKEPGQVYKLPTAQVARDFAVHRVDQYAEMQVEDAHSTPFCLDNPWVFREGDGVSRGEKVPGWTAAQADKIEHYLEHSLAEELA